MNLFPPSGYALVSNDDTVAPNDLWTYNGEDWHKVSLRWITMKVKSLKCVAGVCRKL